MEAEATPLINKLGLQQDDPPRIPPPAPCTSYSGRYEGLDVHVVCNGKPLPQTPRRAALAGAVALSPPDPAR